MTICFFFAEGTCRLGDSCRNEHISQVTYLPELQDSEEEDLEEGSVEEGDHEVEEQDPEEDGSEEGSPEEDIKEEDPEEEDCVADEPSEIPEQPIAVTQIAATPPLQSQLGPLKLTIPSKGLYAKPDSITDTDLCPRIPQLLQTLCQHHSLNAPQLEAWIDFIKAFQEEAHEKATAAYQNQFYVYQQNIAIHQQQLIKRCEVAEKISKDGQERVIHLEKTRSEERARYETERKEMQRKLEWEREERQKMLKEIENERRRRKESSAKQGEEKNSWAREKHELKHKLEMERKSRELVEDRITMLGQGCFALHRLATGKTKDAAEFEKCVSKPRKKRKRTTESEDEDDEDPDSWMEALSAEE